MLDYDDTIKFLKKQLFEAEGILELAVSGDPDRDVPDRDYVLGLCLKINGYRSALSLLGDDPSKEMDVEMEQCLVASNRAARTYHREDRFTSKEISRLWVEILLMSDPTPQGMEKFLAWKGPLVAVQKS